MTWYLGVDAGGSFTRAAILDPETGISGEGHAGPGNPFSTGSEIAFEAIEQAVAGALGQVGCHAFEVAAGCIGVAGLARLPVPEQWQERFAEWRIRDLAVVSDLEIAHYAAFQGTPGIQVIAGTGSSVMVRDEAGLSHVYGGWGWLVGDEGSAVDLGRLAIAHTTAAFDAGQAPDALTEGLRRVLEIDGVPALVSRLYEDPQPRQVLARLAPLVTELAAAGDDTARRLVQTSAAQLARLVEAAAGRLEPETNPQVATAGSVFRSPAFAEAFRQALDLAPASNQVEHPRWSPLAGAVLCAAGLSGVSSDSELGSFLIGL